MHALPPMPVRMLTRYDLALIEDPVRLDAILSDLCGPFHRERSLLAHGLPERSWAELLVGPRGGKVYWRGHCQPLERRRGFLGKVAHWEGECWALSLKLATLTSRLSRPAATLVGPTFPAIPLTQMRLPSFAIPTGANRRNRVQYANLAGLGLPRLCSSPLWSAALSWTELLRIQIPGSKAFASPTGSGTELATLFADQIAVVLGIATDGSRLRIVEPVSGWISSTVVQR